MLSNMDWTIIVSVLGGAVGASIITAFVNWRMKIREEKHESDKWRRDKRIELYSSVTTLHRELDNASTIFASDYADFLKYLNDPSGDEIGLQKRKDRNRELYVRMQTIMQKLDIETNISFMLASEEITDLLGRYGHTATVWVATRFRYLEGEVTKDVADKAEKDQSEAWLDFIQGARKDLGI